MKKWKPYLTVLRLRALLETQYRGAALGGLVTQAFFALVYVFLYMALYGEGDPQGLSATITYVWIQQMLFRLLFSTDGEVSRLILDGGVAYMLVRPVDQHRFWVCRDLGGRLVAAAMRLWPMLLFQLLLPQNMRMAPPHSALGFAQFVVSLMLGVVCLCEINAITNAIIMKTLDQRGIAAMINLLMMALSGNVIPLTLFPDSLQTLIRYQPYAQALDAPIRMYQQTQSMSEWLLNIGVQLGWILILRALGRWMWQRRLNHMIVQGG